MEANRRLEELEEAFYDSAFFTIGWLAGSLARPGARERRRGELLELQPPEPGETPIAGVRENLLKSRGWGWPFVKYVNNNTY